jgi:hypothetical protein
VTAPLGSPDGRAEIGIELGGTDLDADELDNATSRLRRELLELDVDRVDRVTVGEPPPGVRAVELVALGSLLVTLVGRTDVLAAVVSTLKGWLARDANRTLKLELDGDKLELSGVSSGEQDRLVEAWLARHSSR